MLSRLRFALAVVLVVAALWILESFVHSIWKPGRGFVTALLRPDHQQVDARIMSGVFVVFVAVGWRWTRQRSARATRALQASEALYRDVVENCPESIIIHRDGRVLFLNRRALEHLAVPDVASLGALSVDDLVHPADRDLTRRRRSTVMDGREVPSGVDVRLVMPDGSRRTAQVHSALVTFEGEHAVLTFLRDVTEERETRQDLAVSQERLSLALEAAQDGVWDWDMVNDRIVYNEAWARMLGREAMTSAQGPDTWHALVHPDDKERALAAADLHIKGITPALECEVRMRHADGHDIWVLDRGKVVERAPDGTPLRMTGTHRDITARKEAELALELRNSIAEAFLTTEDRSVFDRVLELTCAATESPAGILATFEPNGVVRIAALRGGRQVAERVVDRDALPGEWQEALAARQPLLANETRAAPLVGTSFARSITVPIFAQDQPLGLLVVADRNRDYLPRDVVALGSLAGYLAPIMEFHLASMTKESQLRQAQKMEAIGALAEGIAHDFNNILQAVLGFSTLALEDARGMDDPEGEFIADDLERVVKAAHRGRDLVNRILLFSRRQEQEREPVRVTDVIAEAVGLLEQAMPATIEVEAEVDPACGLVFADPGQISVMLMNLATNGFHAMEDGGGTLTFVAQPVSADEPLPQVPDKLRGTDLVAIAVRDTGCGMDESTLDRLFDPFFTTKEVGKGTGLGLSVVHGVVAGHRGEIVVESAPGRGTTVWIFLPAYGTGSGPVRDAGDTESPIARVLKGARILFVDDEPDIAELGKALLEKQGHYVVAEQDARAAVELVRRSPAGFDLVITDLTMPQMTGDQVATALGEIRADLPVLLITGLNDLSSEVHESHPQIRGVLRKPFGGDTLRNTVNGVLAGAIPPNR